MLMQFIHSSLPDYEYYGCNCVRHTITEVRLHVPRCCAMFVLSDKVILESRLITGCSAVSHSNL